VISITNGLQQTDGESDGGDDELYSSVLSIETRYSYHSEYSSLKTRNDQQAALYCK
jgi:hypothetical protein